MKEAVTKIKTSSNIFELLDNIKEFLRLNLTQEELKEAATLFKNEYKIFVKEYKKTHSKYKQIIIYPDNRPSLLIGFFSSILKEELTNILELLIENYKDEFKRKHTNHINIDDQYQIIDLADSKYHLLELAKKSNKTLNIFHFNYVSKFSSSCNNPIKTAKGYEYFFEVYDIFDGAKERKLNEASIFASGLGTFLNRILMKDPNEAPIGLLRQLKEANITILVENKQDLIKVFGDLFASIILKNSPYQDKYLPSVPESIKSYINEQITLYTTSGHLFKNTKEYQELNDTAECPCGSKKEYQKCCKKKKIKWIIEDNIIKKQIPMNDDVANSLQKLMKIREENFNRYIYSNERILSEMTNLDISFMKHIKMLRDAGISEAQIYAIYKTGRIVTTFNQSMIPNIELQEWNDAIDEYKEIIAKDSKQGLSIITAVRLCNEAIEAFWEDNYITCADAINSFVADHEAKTGLLYNFTINNLHDFLVFCARKAYVNFESLSKAITSNDNDSAMAILRHLYEILINISAYTKNPKQFQEKIIPLAGIDNGTHEYKRNQTGFVSKTRVINKKTGEEYNIQITQKELSDLSGPKYSKLYDLLFQELSFYIHLNVGSSNNFFKRPDPFFEIDPLKLTALLGLFITNQICYELSKEENTSDLLHRDLTYVSDHIKEQMAPLLELIINIEAEENSLYKTMMDIISDYNDIK